MKMKSCLLSQLDKNCPFLVLNGIFCVKYTFAPVIPLVRCKCAVSSVVWPDL